MQHKDIPFLNLFVRFMYFIRTGGGIREFKIFVAVFYLHLFTRYLSTGPGLCLSRKSSVVWFENISLVSTDFWSNNEFFELALSRYALFSTLNQKQMKAILRR